MFLVTTVLVLTIYSNIFDSSYAGPEILRLEPSSDVRVPVNSQENVTFECAVDAGSSLLWQINFVQLQCNSSTDRFILSHEENGIFRQDTLDCNNSTLTITPQWFSNPINTMTAIKCIAFDLTTATCSSEPPGNDFIFVIVFDRPGPPGNLRLEPSSGNLFLVWERPTVQTVVSVTYTVTINSTETDGENFGPFSVGTNTSLLLNFIFLAEEALGNIMCNMFEFFVVAMNAAGPSEPAVVDDTVPISPDVTNISTSLRVGSVRHMAGSTVSFVATFLSVTSCSDTFPVLNYTVTVAGLEGQVVLTNPSTAGLATVIAVELNSTVFPGLVQDALYSVFVNACSVVICRQSVSVPVSTYALQGASAVFFMNNVMVTCLFAVGSRDAGCVFRLIPSIGSTSESIEEFNVTRNGTMSRECLTVDNQRDGYAELIALELESDRSVGEYSILVTDMELEDEGNYTQLTQCTVPRGPNVARIVAPIVVVLVTLLLAALIIVLVLVFVSHKFRLKKMYHKLQARERLKDADRHKGEAAEHKKQADFHKDEAQKHKKKMDKLLTPIVDPHNPSNVYWDFPVNTLKLFTSDEEKPDSESESSEESARTHEADRIAADFDEVDFGEPSDHKKSLIEKQQSVPTESMLLSKPHAKLHKKSPLLVELKPECLRVHLKRDKFTPKTQSSGINTEDTTDTSRLLTPQISIDPDLDLVMEEEEDSEEELMLKGADGGTQEMDKDLLEEYR